MNTIIDKTALLDAFFFNFFEFATLQIERVQIPTLYKKYSERKEEMQNKLQGASVETPNLWIGIASDKRNGVNTKGFDRFNLGQGSECLDRNRKKI